MSKWEKLLRSIRKWNKGEKLAIVFDNSTKDAGERNGDDTDDGIIDQQQG